MNKPRSQFAKLVANGVNLTVLRGIILLSTMITNICLVRYLGVQGFGVFTTISNIYSLYAGISILGFGSFLIREVAKNPKMGWKIFINTLYAGLAVSMVCTLAALVFLQVVYYPTMVRQGTIILLIGLFPSFIVYIAEQLYIAVEEVGFFTRISLIRTLLEMLVVLGVLRAGIHVLDLLKLFLVIRLLFSALWLVYIPRKFKSFKLKADLRFIKKMFQLSVVFSLISVIGGILYKLDILFLSKIGGVYQTGIYSAAMKFVGLEATIINSFIFVFYPVASRGHKQEDPAVFEALCSRILHFFVLAQVLTVVATVGLSHVVITWFYGAKFAESGPVLQILAFLLIPATGTTLLGMLLTAGKSQNYDLVAVLVATPCALALHYFLVRAYGYYGSAVATVLTFGLVLAIQSIFVHRLVFRIAWWASCGKPALTLGLCLLALWGMHSWHGLIKTPVALILCLGLFFLFKMVRWQEIKPLLIRPRADAEVTCP